MSINLHRKSLAQVFIASLLLTLVMPLFLPSLRLLFFVPFLIVASYQKPLQYCIWLAFLCGLCMDLLSSHVHMGIYALTFCAALFLIYPQKRIFFADSLSTLPIMTFLFSFVSTIFLALMFYSIEMINTFSLEWILSDLFLMPIADAFYAFSIFILPGMLIGKPQRRGKDYFLSK